jgi:hypothetical protein
MHVDLIEALRCPHPHADGWLVASVDVVVDRRITRGTVACPMCGQEWEVRDGALHLGVAPLPVARAIVSSNLHDGRADALRTAALLDLREPQGRVLEPAAAGSSSARQSNPLISDETQGRRGRAVAPAYTGARRTADRE